MTRSIVRPFYVFLMCVALAYLEVQIEGPNGWAAALPTWRTLDPRLTWVFGGRPVTGYHVGLTAFILLALHWPILFKSWTFVDECRVLHSYAMMAFVWDFLWFVLNPSFGLARYDATHVWWFRNWFLGVPVDYLIAAGAAVFLRLLPAIVRRESMRDGLREALYGLLIPVLGAALVAVLSLVG